MEGLKDELREEERGLKKGNAEELDVGSRFPAQPTHF